MKKLGGNIRLTKKAEKVYGNQTAIQRTVQTRVQETYGDKSPQVVALISEFAKKVTLGIINSTAEYVHDEKVMTDESEFYIDSQGAVDARRKMFGVLTNNKVVIEQAIQAYLQRRISLQLDGDGKDGECPFKGKGLSRQRKFIKKANKKL